VPQRKRRDGGVLPKITTYLYEHFSKKPDENQENKKEQAFQMFVKGRNQCWLNTFQPFNRSKPIRERFVGSGRKKREKKK
jgi:hypothetical protein